MYDSVINFLHLWLVSLNFKNNLKIILDTLRNSKYDEKYEVAVTVDEQEKNLSYSIYKAQYNLYTLSNEILEKNYLLVGGYIKEKAIEKMKEETIFALLL